MSPNEDVEMGKSENQVGPHQKINDDIGKEVHIEPIETVMENRILNWFGH